jgi:16S rRNA (cytosine1402-N4)-methyltransferase
VQTSWQHTTVLLDEAVDALVTDPDATYIDATFGRGGHSRLILSRLSPDGRLVAFDKDPVAVAESAKVGDARFSIRHQGFRHLGDLPPASAAGVLMDLGVSSPQIDNPERGFSFRFDGRWTCAWTPRAARAWRVAGNSRGSTDRRGDTWTMAKNGLLFPLQRRLLLRRQERGPVSTTTELAGLVAGAVKTREPGQNPATRTFQALRIFINAELEELQQALEASLHVLRPGGRLVVISFHSLEDRIVKQFIATHSRDEFDRRAPFAPPKAMKLKALGRVRPGQDEVAANARARSAIMRVAERTAA